MPISVSHFKTVTIADQTNTAIVRPSDWNSAHSVVFSPEGNELLPAFSNAGNVSFGTNAQSKITASVALAAGLALSAGTQSVNSGTLALANSNGITFGMSGSSQITASHNGLTTAALSNHSHGNPSLALTNLSGTTASNSAGVTFSLSAGNYLTTAALSNHSHGFSASGGSSAFQTLNFANSNGITFSNSNGSVIASHNGLTTAAQSNHSHGNPSLALTNLSGTTASNSAGLTLSISAGNYLTTAAQSNHSHGNPTLNLTNLSGTTASNSAGFTLSLSAAAGGGGADGYNILAAGTQTATTAGTVKFENSNGISFGMSGSTQITASHNGLTTAAQSNHSHGVTLNLTNINGTTGGDSNGINLSLSAVVPAQTVQTQNMVSVLGSTGNISFANSNGITFGGNASTVTASHNGLTTAAQSNHSHGNPTLALTNLSGTTASNSAGLTLSLSAAAGGGGADGYNILAAGSQTATTAGTVKFENSNGISFGMSGSTQITASHNGLTTAALSNHSHAFSASGGSSAFQTLSFSAQNGVSFTNTNGQVGIVHALQYTSNTSAITANAAHSTHSHGNPTLALTNLSGTTASASNGLTLSLSAQARQSNSVYLFGNTSGIASSLTNNPSVANFAGGAHVTLNYTTNTDGVRIVEINAAGGGGGGGVAVSAGTQSVSTGTVAFANSNGITFGMSGSSQITASHDGLTTAALSNHSHGNPTLALTNLSGTTASASDGFTLSLSAGAGGGGGFTASAWNPYANQLNVVGIHGNATLLVQPLQLQNPLSVDRMCVPFYFSNASNSAGTVYFTFRWGVYTDNAGTLSRLFSTSTGVSMGYASNNSSASQRGIRLLTFPMSTTLPQSDYFVAVNLNTAFGGSTATLSQLLVSQLNSNFSGLWDAASSASNQPMPGFGYYSASTTAMPASLAFSNIQGTNSLCRRPPMWYATNGFI